MKIGVATIRATRFRFFLSLFFSFVLSLPVWFLYRLLRFYFPFPALLGGGFCYSVISSRRYTPPQRSWWASRMRIPLACCLLACVADVDFFFFSSLPALTRFRFGHRLFSSCFFLWVLCCLLGFGSCCDSFSISSLLPPSSTRRRFYPQRSSGRAVVTGVVPSPPLRAFNFYRA